MTWSLQHLDKEMPDNVLCRWYMLRNAAAHSCRTPLRMDACGTHSESGTACMCHLRHGHFCMVHAALTDAQA